MQIEVTGPDGQRRKLELDETQAAIAQNGERLHIPMIFMDAMKGSDTMSNDKYQVSDDQQKRVEDAYQEMCRDLQNGWRGPDYKPPTDTGNLSAYDQARRDLENAWRNGR